MSQQDKEREEALHEIEKLLVQTKNNLLREWLQKKYYLLLKEKFSKAI
jgi:tRNA A22 N-methylase